MQIGLPAQAQYTMVINIFHSSLVTRHSSFVTRHSQRSPLGGSGAPTLPFRGLGGFFIYLNFHFMNHRSLKVSPMLMLITFSVMSDAALALR